MLIKLSPKLLYTFKPFWTGNELDLDRNSVSKGRKNTPEITLIKYTSINELVLPENTNLLYFNLRTVFDSESI